MPAARSHSGVKPDNDKRRDDDPKRTRAPVPESRRSRSDRANDIASAASASLCRECRSVETDERYARADGLLAGNLRSKWRPDCWFGNGVCGKSHRDCRPSRVKGTDAVLTPQVPYQVAKPASGPNGP